MVFVGSGAQFKGISMATKLDYFCVAQYRMNDNATNTTVVDSQGYSNGDFNDATGDPNTDAHTITGKINTALSFDGVDDHIVILNDTTFDFGTDDFSVCFIMKLTDITTTQDIITRQEDAYHYTKFFIQSSKLYSEFASAQSDSWGHSVALTSGMIDNWVFVVFVKTSTGVQIYFNGSAESTTTGFQDGDPNLTFAANTYIGCIDSLGVEGLIQFLDGSLDNVMIFNKALSQTEITYLYNSGNGREL